MFGRAISVINRCGRHCPGRVQSVEEEMCIRDYVLEIIDTIREPISKHVEFYIIITFRNTYSVSLC